MIEFLAGICVGALASSFFYVNNISKTRIAVNKAQEEWHELYSNLVIGLNEEIQKLEQKFDEIVKGKK